MIAALCLIVMLPQVQAAAQDTNAGKIIRDCADCPEIVVILAGSFEMGETGSTHRVTLKSFAIGKTEITQAQWKAIMNNNPSDFNLCGDTCPVENVSRDDAQVFIQKLNAKTGKHYRLPSEAEWEYACRAGEQNKYCGSDDVDSVAWYEKNCGKTTHPAAQKQANLFGLYDMTGNVWEWVEDSYHDNYNGAPTDGSAWRGDATKSVLRGGSWVVSNADRMRSTIRGFGDPSFRNVNIGFRVARTLP
jgi:formylglycine-generating enzyme required for sulfatase activity